MAAILQNKMAAKMWTYQLASIKIPVERYLNYLCAKIHNFIQKCTPNYLRAPTIVFVWDLYRLDSYRNVDKYVKQMKNLDLRGTHYFIQK